MDGSVRKGILWTGLEKVLVYGVNFVQGIVLARLLCPEDFGLTVLLGIFLGLGGTLAESGLGTALVVFRAERHCRRALTWNMGVALAVYALLAALAPSIARWYGKPILAPLMWTMALGLVIHSASIVATARLTREEKFGRLAWANGASTIVAASVAVLLAWWGFGVWSIVWMGVIGAAVRTGMVWALGRGDVREEADEVPFGAVLRYGWKLMASGLIHVVYSESYNLIIGKLWSPASVGLFARGQRWARLPGEVVNEAVGRVALPRLAASSRRMRLRMEGLRLCVVNCVLLWLGLAVLGIWADEVVGFVLGAQWLTCVPYLRILLVGQAMTPIGGMALQVIRASGRSELILKTDAWKKPLGLVALFGGIPFGVIGLCWAKVASDAVEAVVDVIYALGLCRPKKGERWLMDMDFAYRVFSDMRPWLWRFAVLVHRRRIGPTTHPDTWCHYMIALLECGRMRAFDRVLARYVRLKGDIGHFAAYFRLAEVAVARGCRDSEVVRTAEVWDRLCASRKKRSLADFVKGKTVAVVGNGPQELGKGLGAEIDAHEVVIRINNYDLTGLEADYGRRTDVWVKNTTEEMRHVKPSPEIRAIIYNGNWERDRLELGYRDHIADDLTDGSVFVDFLDTKSRQEVSEAIEWVPTTGGLVISALRRCACSVVDVYGCSCLSEGRGAYRRLPKDVPEERVAQMVAWHHFDCEVACLSRLLDGRSLRK